mmetsp:Transcript_15947/g.24677  ORF Transcript_15947/g.24677 Transcript_15947/m.24677 type:complete len:92 (+) Transcript_15947:789-1064(+)
MSPGKVPSKKVNETGKKNERDSSAKKLKAGESKAVESSEKKKPEGSEKAAGAPGEGQSAQNSQKTMQNKLQSLEQAIPAQQEVDKPRELQV